MRAGSCRLAFFLYLATAGIKRRLNNRDGWGNTCSESGFVCAYFNIDTVRDVQKRMHEARFHAQMHGACFISGFVHAYRYATAVHDMRNLMHEARFRARKRDGCSESGFVHALCDVNEMCSLGGS